MTKIALLTNLPAPYRLPLFKALAEHPSIILKVYFCPDRAELLHRQWGFDNLEFDHDVMHSWIPNASQRVFWFNPFLLNRLLEFRPHVVIAWSSLAGIMAAFYCCFGRIPLILWSGGTQTTETTIGLFRRIVRWFLYRRAAHFWAYSEEANQYIQSWGVSVDKISILGNMTLDPVEYHHWIEQHHMEGQEMKLASGWSSKIILAVGQLTEKKNYLTLLKAFLLLRDKIPDITLLLVGDGPLRPELEYFCKANNLQGVFLIGTVSVAQMPLYYGISSVFAHPAIYDQWPQVINEAMAAGLPVLASSSAGLPKEIIVDDVDGYLLNPIDYKEWAAKLEYLLSNPELAKNMGQESCQLIRKYGVSQVMGIATQSIHQLMKRGL